MTQVFVGHWDLGIRHSAGWAEPMATSSWSWQPTVSPLAVWSCASLLIADRNVRSWHASIDAPPAPLNKALGFLARPGVASFDLVRVERRRLAVRSFY